MSETELVLERREGAVAVIALNRPERHHALNRALSAAIADAVTRAETDGEARVIVLTGTGEKAFCAGADMLESSGVEPPSANGPNRGSTAANAIEAVTKAHLPVIAAINGYCYGGGARLAVACDIRLASETATFRLPGSEYGLVVAASTLPRLVGAARAKELIFTARKFDAAEAFAYGLVTSVHSPSELMPAALEMATTIAGHSASAIQEAKRVIDTATLDAEADAMENEINKRLRGSPEQVQRFRDATQRVTGR